MKRLRVKATLIGNNTISIYVPSTTKGQKEISKRQFGARERLVSHELSHLFANKVGNTLFGGATDYPATGYYLEKPKNQKELFVREKVEVVSTSAPSKKLRANIRTLESFIKKEKAQWHQNAVSFGINNRLFFD